MTGPRKKGDGVRVGARLRCAWAAADLQKNSDCRGPWFEPRSGSQNTKGLQRELQAFFVSADQGKLQEISVTAAGELAQLVFHPREHRVADRTRR